MRVPTGIRGLDKIIEGGIPENDLVLLTGASGTGKTIFGLHFLYSAADAEPGIYISFEETQERIRKTAQRFGWDIEAYENANRIKILQYDPFRLEDIFEIIQNSIREMGAKRIFIDSISALGTYARNTSELRRMIIQLSTILRKSKCTSILASEIVPGKKSLSRFGVEEFVTDGVIILHKVLAAGQYKNGISVWKMKDTDHSEKIHPYDISRKGFIVYPNKILKTNKM